MSFLSTAEILDLAMEIANDTGLPLGEALAEAARLHVELPAFIQGWEDAVRQAGNSTAAADGPQSH